MKPILILYATREGYTRRISEHLAATVRARDIAAEVINVAQLPPAFSLAGYSAAIVAASVHVGKHEPEMTAFVRRHVTELHQMPAAFLSVSLSEAGVEGPDSTPKLRSQAAGDVARMIETFLADTGWHPQHIRAVAGALLYTQYNFLIRFVMKMIARRVGAPTDTSRDHEFTDWQALDHVVDAVLTDLPQPQQ